MGNKITVAEAIIKNGWCNIKTNEGKEVSVMLEKAPKVKAQVEAKINQMGDIECPFDLECKTVDKNGKIFAWDFEEKKEGGKSFGKPRNEKLIVAQSSYNYAINYLVGCKGTFDLKELDTTAKHIFTEVCKLGGLSES